MPLILNIETSTEVCSVALARNGNIVTLKENLSEQNHAKLLTLFIAELLDESEIAVDQLDAIAVSGGPGSYTGLRIGVSVAKGMCYGAKLPLIAITSLEAMANHVICNITNEHTNKSKQNLFCPMIDARRMEVYTSFYDINCNQIREIKADIIDHQSYIQYLNEGFVFFFGNGASKCREAINHPNAIFINDIVTSASHMISLSEQKFKAGKFADVAYYEPFYLKDFIATIPVKNIFKTN